MHFSEVKQRDFLFLMYQFIYEVSIKTIYNDWHYSATIGKFFKEFHSSIAADYELCKCLIGVLVCRCSLAYAKFGSVNSIGDTESNESGFLPALRWLKIGKCLLLQLIRDIGNVESNYYEVCEILFNRDHWLMETI